MSTPDYRAVLAELLAAQNSYHLFTDVERTTAAQRAERMHQATRAAAEALAAPEAQTGSYQPSPTTPEEIDDRLRRVFRKCIADGVIKEVPANSPVIASPEAVDPTDGDAHELWALAQLAPGEGIEDGVNRIAPFFARYGTPAPVPVAERLPELRGMFERLLCLAGLRDHVQGGHIKLADRLIGAVVAWADQPPATQSGDQP